MHSKHPPCHRAMASQTPSELAISNVRWRQQLPAALPQATSGAGAVAAATYREVHEGATAAMASQTPSELALSSVRWRQQPPAAPRASKASGGTVCSLSPACLAPEPASAATVQDNAGPAFQRHSPPGAQATTVRDRSCGSLQQIRRCRAAKFSMSALRACARS